MAGGKVLGIDFGTRRIGLATGDLMTQIAFPRMVINNEGFELVLSELENLIEEWGISVIVVGLPVNDQGYEENPLREQVDLFVQALKEKFSEIEVDFLDEGYSSFEADNLMNDIAEKGQDKIGRDAYAAQVILQRFFDKQGQ